MNIIMILSHLLSQEASVRNLQKSVKQSCKYQSLNQTCSKWALMINKMWKYS